METQISKEIKDDEFAFKQAMHDELQQVMTKLTVELDMQSNRRQAKREQAHIKKIDQLSIHGEGLVDELESELIVLRNEFDDVLQTANKNSSGEIFEFEVSGKLFREARDLLCQVDVEQSKLAQLFSGDITLPKTDKGVPFLNRDSDAVSHMLKHLKSDRRFIPKDLDARELFNFELEHWGLELTHLVVESEQSLTPDKPRQQEFAALEIQVV